MSRSPGRVKYTEIMWGGQVMTPVQFVADALITLVPPKTARKLYRAGTVGILSADQWAVIQSNKGAGLNLDPGYVR